MIHKINDNYIDLSKVIFISEVQKNKVKYFFHVVYENSYRIQICNETESILRAKRDTMADEWIKVKK